MTAKWFVQQVSEIEELAEAILTDKEQIKELDHKRNANREALTAIKKCNDSKKSWMCLGGLFIKYPTRNISETINKDQEELKSEMEDIRKELKEKISMLHKLEGKQQPKGFDLTALRKDELSAFTVQN